ncbi:hypothetical protein CcNV_086 [Crangon crangon nudivirus]|uniref:Uncharacterized protein n=1 Tax=Crangon crangon nudivirus TaxID=2880838 RepID=A0AAE8Y0S1_9VIRU|nr:hypothetical protein QKT25_gp087 [Crangon crangon nudivirus]UBZ25571.1 hypothetical protein CcNV_086 [Crangon crangon nudivirus]
MSSNNITLRKLIELKNVNTAMQFKAIPLDGDRYIITVKNGHVIDVYNAKQKAMVKVAKQMVATTAKPVPESIFKNIASKINHYFTNLLALEVYTFEIILSNKGMTIVDIIDSTAIANLENMNYKDRINTISSIFSPLNLPRLTILNNQGISNTSSSTLSNVTTSMILRPLASCYNFGYDYLVTPMEKLYTYVIVGEASYLKPNIVIKKEPFNSLGSITSAIKNKLTEGREDLLEQITKATVEKQLEAYNMLKTTLFEKYVNQDQIVFENKQVNRVQLVAAKTDKNKLAIFGMMKLDTGLTKDITYVVQNENIIWSNDKFASNFTDIRFYKNVHVTLCKQMNKYIQNKLSNIVMDSIMSSLPIEKLIVREIDTLPVQEKIKPQDIYLNNATNTDIFKECMRRLQNIALENESTEAINLMNTLGSYTSYESDVGEAFHTLIRRLQLTEQKKLVSVVTDINKYFEKPDDRLLASIKENMRKHKRHARDEVNDIRNLKRIKMSDSESE